MESDKERLEYLELYHSIINTGISYGLTHPIEWWINYTRVIDTLRFQVGIDTIDPKIIYKYSKKYFDEMYEAYNINPPNEENVKSWICSFYKQSHMFKNSFEELMLTSYDYEKNKQ